MENILLFHVGVPKTGTTSIQRMLYQNKEKLAEEEWFYPDLYKELDIDIAEGYRHINGGVFLANRESGDFFWNSCENSAKADQRWEKIINVLTPLLEQKNVLISDESFFRQGCTSLFEKIKPYFNNIKVIVYLRRQDRWMESEYNQEIKGNRLFCDFQKFIEQTLEYREILEEIEKCIGKDNMIVRVFEKEKFYENNLLLDFMSNLGIYKIDNWKLDGYSNKSLSGHALELLKIINQVSDSQSHFFYKEWIMNESAKNNLRSPIGLFSESERVSFLKKYEKENEYIARYYMQYNNGKLFSDKNMNLKQYVAEPNTIYEKLMEMIVSVMPKVDLFRSIIEFCTIYSMQEHKKKLCLFGASSIAYKILSEYSFDIECIIDNDLQNNGKRICNIPVVSFSEVMDWEKKFVVISCIHFEEISMQLKEIGLKRGQDFL